MLGSEKSHAEPDWKRRQGYRLLGELHVPGRLRVWHLITMLRQLGYWRNEPLSVLDAGGGKGAFAYYCARRFSRWHVVVADDDAPAIARGERIQAALNLHNLELRCVDLLDVADKDRYDVIICSDVLEHIDDDDRVVRNLAGALKSGGRLLLTAPSIPQRPHLVLVKWRERQIGFHPSQYGHVRDGYSVDEIKGLFEQANLKECVVRQTFGRYGTLMFDLFFVTGDSQPNPLLYMLLFPVYIGLSVLDVAFPIRHGSGVLAVGEKP